MERRALRRGAALLLALVVVGAAIVLGVRACGDDRPGAGPRDARAPEGVRIKVQVLNATTTRGLARQATRHLRDRGFDVVEIGTDATRRDSTLVLDRSGHAEWAALVGRALGGARVEQRPDSSRYVDVTVLLGASWRPPAEAFYP